MAETATTTGNIDIGFGPGQLSATGHGSPAGPAYPLMVQAGQYATYTLPGSPGPSEDLSIVKATVALATLMQPSNSAAVAYYNKLTAQTFQLAALSGLPSSGTTAANMPFTELATALRAHSSWAPYSVCLVTPGPGDARRFQNNTATNAAAPGPINYRQRHVTFEPQVHCPNAAAPAPPAAGSVYRATPEARFSSTEARPR